MNLYRNGQFVRALDEHPDETRRAVLDFPEQFILLPNDLDRPAGTLTYGEFDAESKTLIDIWEHVPA